MIYGWGDFVNVYSHGYGDEKQVNRVKIFSSIDIV